MIRILLSCFILVSCLPTPSSAQSPPYAKAEKADAAAKAEVERQGLVGTAVVVFDGGKVVWSKGYGDADREAKVAVDPAVTSFRWASISKTVTAIAAMQLVEQGKLDLDADVRKYVPEFPDKGVTITSRQLLCHQAGIVHYANGKVIKTIKTYSDPHPFVNVVTALDTFKESPLIAKPGEKFSYTTHGYILLSAVVERAGGEAFVDQVKKRIVTPLGLKSFRPDYQWEDIPNRTKGYTRIGVTVAVRPADKDPDVSWKLGGGGYTSTAMDLATYGVGLAMDSIVSTKTREAMTTKQKLANGQDSGPYGLGFTLGTTPGGIKWFGHSGGQEKTRTILVVDTIGKRGVAVMTNSEWAEPMKVAVAVMDSIQ